MWLVAELFEALPEAGDLPQPKLVVFLDEAHLLFADATEAFLDALARTVRLIRSKGVGVFFVTQQPTDLSDGGARAARPAHPARAARVHAGDAKKLRATVSTYPRPTSTTSRRCSRRSGSARRRSRCCRRRACRRRSCTRACSRPPRAWTRPTDVEGAAKASPLWAKYGEPGRRAERPRDPRRPARRAGGADGASPTSARRWSTSRPAQPRRARRRPGDGRRRDRRLPALARGQGAAAQGRARHLRDAAQAHLVDRDRHRHRDRACPCSTAARAAAGTRPSRARRSSASPLALTPRPETVNRRSPTTTARLDRRRPARAASGWLMRPSSAIPLARSTRKPAAPVKSSLSIGSTRELRRRPPQERVVVPLDGRARAALAELRLLQPRRLREVGDVEQRELQALDAAVLVRLLADAEQQVVADRVQVGGVAGDLQLARDARLRRVGEVERVERVGLAERDDVADVADEADGVDPLAAAEPADLAALDEVPVLARERRDLALAPRRPSRPWSRRAGRPCPRTARTG